MYEIKFIQTCKMSDKKDENLKGNTYDRVFRENAESLFLPLVEMRLNLKIKTYQPLQEKISKTIEREVDFLYKIETASKEIKILHLEFQSENDKNMIFRMQEYHGLIQKKYKLPIVRYVIYLGSAKFNMRSQLNSDEIFTGFDYISINEYSPETFLSSEVPEMVIMALLGNYDKNEVEFVLKQILEKLKKLSKSEKIASRYINQLIFLSRLRKLDKKVNKIIENMPVNYDVSTDYLYQKGLERGILACYKLGNSIESIAKEMNVSVERVLLVIKKFEESQK